MSYVGEPLDTFEYLVRGIAHQLGITPRLSAFDDVVQAGFLGLCDAATKFDAGRGVPFKSYAALRIRGAMQDYMRSVDWAPRSVRLRIREAAVSGAWDTATRVDARLLSLRSIDEPLEQHDGIYLGDTIEERADEQLPCELWDAVSRLPERLAFVIEQRYRNDHSVAEIAAVLGVSESRVSQLVRRGLDLLRGAIAA